MQYHIHELHFDTVKKNFWPTSANISKWNWNSGNVNEIWCVFRSTLLQRYKIAKKNIKIKFKEISYVYFYRSVPVAVH